MSREQEPGYKPERRGYLKLPGSAGYVEDPYPNHPCESEDQERRRAEEVAGALQMHQMQQQALAAQAQQPWPGS